MICFAEVSIRLTLPSSLFVTYALRPSRLMATPSGWRPTARAAALVGCGKVTSMLKNRGLLAVPFGAARSSGPVVAPTGTCSLSVSGSDVRSGATAVLLKSTTLSAATALKSVPTIVTTVPGNPPEGLAKRIRGPPGRAIWLPVNAPCAPLSGWVQRPLALPSERFTAVRVQLFSLQPKRVYVPETTLLVPGDPSSVPSIQSTSPNSVAVPAAVD